MSDLRSAEQRVIDDLPPAFLDEHLTPEHLGARLALCATCPSLFDRLRTEIQRRLLHRTVAVWKDRSALLSERLAEIDSDAVLREGPAVLPVSSRDLLKAEQSRLCLRDLTLDFCCFTSGSTTGEPLVVYRSREEHLFLRELLEVVRSTSSTDDYRSDEGGLLGLTRTNPHGRSMGLGPRRKLVLVVPFESAADAALAVRLLERSFIVDQEKLWLTSIHSAASDMVRFTGALVRLGREDLASRVTRLSFTGRMLSRREYRALKDFWQCPINNVFSMAEVYTSSTYCEECDGFHFDPYAMYEVLEPETLEPLSEGRGRLAVTGLFPLHQMTPFLRYLNGDVVDIWTTECPLGPRTFRPLGRFPRSCRIETEGRQDFLLCPGDVLDILDELPDLRRSNESVEDERWVGEWGALPVFQLVPDGRGARICLEVRFDPEMFPGRARNVGKRLEEELVKALPVAGSAFASGALVVDVLGPGCLSAVGSAEELVHRQRALRNDPLGIPGLPV